MTTSGNDYLPNPISSILLKCHCCFSMVEVDEPATGLVYTCDMCRADLEIADMERGHTRPPVTITPAPGILTPIAMPLPVPGLPPAMSPSFPFPVPITPPTAAGSASGRLASSATLFRKGPAAAADQDADSVRPSPSAVPPRNAGPNPGRSRRERELEPTTEPHPGPAAAGMARRLLRILAHPWTVMIIGFAAGAALIALWWA